MKTSLYRRSSNYFLIIGKLSVAALLFATIASFAYADNNERIEHLQKVASIAYDKMMQAKQSAENATKDAAFAEKKFAALKQKLATAEQEYASAKKKSDQAKVSFEHATRQWKEASDTLALEWNKAKESQ